MTERFLIKAPNWLGDAVMSLPLVQALHTMKPRAYIAALARRSVADLYRASPAVSETLSYDSAVQAVTLARAAKADVAIIVPRSFAAALTLFTVRIPRRIGYRGEGRSLMLTDTVRPDPSLQRKHRVYTYHHLLSALGEAPPPSAPSLVLPKKEKEWAREHLHGEGWIAINPGATYGAAKQWRPDRFSAVAKRLGHPTVIVGGPSEAELGARIAATIPGALNLTGKTSILQLAAALERCRLLVTNDTGPMHVADAVGTPIVAVFGPTDWVTTPPFGPRHTLVRRDIDCAPCLERTCPLGHHHCMEWLTVDEVVRACHKWLEGNDALSH